MTLQKIPSFYFSGRCQSFQGLIEKTDGVTKRKYKKEDILTHMGRNNDTAYFIVDGLLQLSILHEDGFEQIMSLFGRGEIFPVGVMRHNHTMDYSMILTAYTDLEVYAMTYDRLRQLAYAHPELALALLEGDCDMISYLFYTSSSLAFSPCLTRICDVLYLTDRYTSKKGHVLDITQRFLTNLIGSSTAQAERALKQLRQEGIIKTGRGTIQILDMEKLQALCSDSVFVTGEE